MKKAILVVSFGTTFLDTLEKTIAAIEKDIAAAFPDRKLFRAFTSGMIMKRLLERDGMEIDNVTKAMERLLAEGYTDVVVQPTHVMNGDEYDKLRLMAAPFEEKFDRLVFGAPLLTATQDYYDAVEAICAHLPEKKAGAAVVLMGHGTPHHANAVYAALEYVFKDSGREDVAVGTVEGYPELDEVCRRLAEMKDIQSVTCLPLMVVAGDHARNDMAGDEEDSWKSQLSAKGYEVTCLLEGLGEYPEIRSIFVRHALEAAQ